MGEDRLNAAVVRWLGFATLMGFGGIGMLLIRFAQHRDPVGVVFSPWLWTWQLALGLGVGAGIAVIASWLVDRPFMDAIRARYVERVGALFRSWLDILFVSLCAGVGEELFFRGALQYWLGIVLTAVLFVAVHGYLHPGNWRMSIYGITLTFGMMLLGWMADRTGLLGPIVAHTVIDVVLLTRLARAHQRNVQS